jgi:signal peptidase I
MQPTLTTGDHIVVVPDRQPERGQVIVFRSPQSPEELVVKRIIATPGDLIATEGGRVTIGSHILPEPYAAQPAGSGPIAPQIVPSGCYFVMGNRTNSFDSRHWGVLRRELVVGRAVMVLWSSSHVDSETPANAAPLFTSPLRPRLRSERLFKFIR